MNGAGLNLPSKTQVIKIFLPLRFYGTGCPHMNGAGLNLPGKTQVIKIDRTSFLNRGGGQLPIETRYTCAPPPGNR